MDSATKTYIASKLAAADCPVSVLEWCEEYCIHEGFNCPREVAVHLAEEILEIQEGL